MKLKKSEKKMLAILAVIALALYLSKGISLQIITKEHQYDTDKSQGYASYNNIQFAQEFKAEGVNLKKMVYMFDVLGGDVCTLSLRSELDGSDITSRGVSCSELCAETCGVYEWDVDQTLSKLRTYFMVLKVSANDGTVDQIIAYGTSMDTYTDGQAHIRLGNEYIWDEFIDNWKNFYFENTYDDIPEDIFFDANEAYECTYNGLNGDCIFQERYGNWYSYCTERPLPLNDLIITSSEFNDACIQTTTTTTTTTIPQSWCGVGTDDDCTLLLVGGLGVLLAGLFYYKRVKKK